MTVPGSIEDRRRIASEELAAEREAEELEQREYRRKAFDVMNQSSPEDAAEALKLGEQFGVPRQAIELDPKVWKQRNEEARRQLLAASIPRTMAWMDNIDNHAVAKDEIDLWGSVEGFFYDYVKDAPGAMRRDARNIGRAFKSGLMSAESSIADADREQLEKAARYYDDFDAWKAREAERVAAGKGGFINRLGFNTVDVGTLRMQLPGDTDPMPQPTMRLLDEAANRNATAFEKFLGIPGADYKGSQRDVVIAIKPLIQDKMREAVRVSEAKSKAVEEMMPQTGDFVADSLLGGVRAISEMTPLIVSAIASRGKTIPTVVMTGQVYYNEYATGREKGLEIDQATERAVLQAGVESISERISLGIIDNVIKDGGPLALRFTKGIILEQGQEQVATMGGRLVDWAYLEKDKTIQEFIDETPRAMLQTALTTLVASSGMQATFLAADYATQKFLGDSVMTDPSKGDQFIANVMEKFAKANLGKRSPEKAADLVNKIVEGTGAETVVVDLDGLAQSLTTAGMDVREVLTQLGVDPDAIGELGQLMGTAEIPMGRLATPSAQLLSSQIIPHMRLATEDLTPFQKTELEDIAELAKRYATDVKEDVARDESKLGAFMDVQEQIYTAAKGSGLNLTEEQYRHNANIAATNVAYIAMKRGQDVRETWAELGPKIMGRDGSQPQTQGSAALESAKVAGYQGEDRGEAESWLRAVEKYGAEGMVWDMPDGSDGPRKARARELGYDVDNVLYHGTQADFDAFDLARSGENAGIPSERAIFLSADPAFASMFASVFEQPKKGAKVMPLYVRGKIKTLTADDLPDLAVPGSDGVIKYRSAAFADIIDQAKAEGFDGVRIKNVTEGNDGLPPSDQIAIFDPANIRSTNAAFDPDQADSADLLAQSIRASVRMPMAEVDAWVRDNVDSNFQDFQNGDESAVMTWNLTEDPDSPQVMMGIRLNLEGRADVNLFLDSKMADAMDNVQDVSERRRLAIDMFSQAILVMRKYEAETPDLKAFNFIAAESQADGTNPKSREQLYRSMLSTLKMDGYTAYEVTGQMSVVNTDADGAKVANPLFTPGSKFVLIKDGVDVNEFAKTEILRGTQRGGDAGEVVTALKAVPLTRSARRGVDGGGRDAGRPDPGRDGQQGAENLTQPRRGGYDPKTREMSFSGISDASTLLHENSHWFLATLEELAPTEKWAADDLAEINRWYQSVRETPKMTEIRLRYSVIPEGEAFRIIYDPPADMIGNRPPPMKLERVASMEEAQAKIEWRERQEAWAETTEEYFMTGESPTPRLKQILRDFKNWLVQVYNGMLPGERANLTPEIRSMMDRILAVDVEVDAASAEVFRNARKMADEMLGKGIITPRQHKLVGDRLDKAREEVKEELLARVMQEKLEAGQASRAMERTLIKGDIARAFDKSPVGRAFNWLAYGEWMGDLPNEPGTAAPEAEDARSNKEVFQFAGVNAATANLSELERAKRMAQQGASRDEIWEATGWNQRVDGNWRFEVSDDKAALTGMKSGRLEDVLQHPELYDAYPGLRNVIVEDTSSVDAASLGVAADGTLIVRVNWPRVERQDGSGLLSILHELQHGIQTIETWSGGFSPDAVTTDALKAVNKVRKDLDSGAIWWTPVDVYRRVAGEVEARTTETRAGMTAEERRRTPPEDDIPRGEQIKDPNLLLAVSEQKNRVMALLTGKPAAVRFSADQLFDRDGGQLYQFETPGSPQYEAAVRKFGVEGMVWQMPDGSDGPRKARARAMGYNVDNVLYHGTDVDFEAFRTTIGTYGEGVYLTDSPDEAGRYASGYRLSRQFTRAEGSGPNIIATYVRGQIANINDYYFALEEVRSERSDINENTSSGAREVYRLAGEKLAAQGFAGHRVQEPNAQFAKAIVIYDPANVRSVNAAFDPDNSESAVLLGQNEKDKQKASTESSVDRLQMVAERGVRDTAENVRISAEEREAMEASAKATGVPIEEIEAAVRKTKAAHPVSQGWEPVIYSRTTTDKKEEGKEGEDKKVTHEYKQVPYGFALDASGNTLAPGTGNYTRRVNSLAKSMTEEVRSILRRARAGDANARNIIAQAAWYKAMRKRLRQEFGGLGDLFADLLGATSPNTPVRDNWFNAVEALRRASRGDFDELIVKWEAYYDQIDALELDLRAWFNNEMKGEADAEGNVVRAPKKKKEIKNSPEYLEKITALKELRKFPQELLPKKENEANYGFNGRNVARAMVDLWRVIRDADPDINRGGTAPKALNFSGNLIGFRTRATIDVWAARILQRLTGRRRIPSVSEPTVSGVMRQDGSTTLSFALGQDVFSAAVKRIRSDTELNTDPTLAEMNDDDLQALVWFIEKEIWTINNWTNAAGEGGSFELEADLTGTSEQEQVRILRRVLDASPPTADLKAAELSTAEALEAIEAHESKHAAEIEELRKLESGETEAYPGSLKRMEALGKIARPPAEHTRLLNRVARAKERLEEFEARKIAARGLLAGLERQVDRFVGGLSIQMSQDTQGINFVPEDADMARLGAAIREAIYAADDGATVLGSKTLSTQGRYGSVERSLDLEIVAREGYDANAVWKEILRQGQEAKQDSVFLSRVLRKTEKVDPLVHRPGVEIYFREAADRAKLETILAELADPLNVTRPWKARKDAHVAEALRKWDEQNPGLLDRDERKDFADETGNAWEADNPSPATVWQQQRDAQPDADRAAWEAANPNPAGAEFLTVVVDGRRLADTMAGQMPAAVGVRLQYIPEFEQRYGMDNLSELDDKALIVKMQKKAAELRALTDRVSESVEGVSFAGQFWYETQTAFSSEYQEKTDALTTGTVERGVAGAPRGQQWQGDTIRAGLASADRQLRETSRREPDVGVLGGIEGAEDAPASEGLGQDGESLGQPRKFNPPGHGAIAPPTDIPPVRLDLKLVKDLYGEEAVRKLPAAVRRRSSTSSNVTDIIQQIEAVRKVLSVKRKGPQTLTQFIMQRSVKQQDGSKRNRQWGIKGAAGELKAMGLERLINEKSGMPIDAMRELAEEAGFIRAETGGARATEYGDLDATPNDLLDALAREAKGEPVVRIGEEVDNKELDDAKAWASWLEQNGVDIYETDQRKLRASVDQMLRDSDESLVSPDKAAEMFGFANGEELLKALAEVGNRDAFLNKMADQKMVEEFGDMMTDGTLQAEAAEAARLDIAHRQNEIEMEALARALGQQASANYAKSLAKDIIAMRTVKEIAAYERDLNNERQFGKQALRLVEKGDYPAALKAKQRQLVSMQLYTEGKKAHERIEKQRQDLLKYYTSEGRRDKIAADYLEQIEAVLDDFELRVSKQGPKEQRTRNSAAEYVAAMTLQGREAEIAPEAMLLAGLNEKMVWRNMTAAEVEHLVGTIQNLAHLGRTKDGLMKAQEKRKFRAVVSTLVERLRAAPSHKDRSVPFSPTLTDQGFAVLRYWDSKWAKIEDQMALLDGSSAGPLVDTLVQPFAEADAREGIMLTELTRQLRGLHKTLTERENRQLVGRRVSTPELALPGNRQMTMMDVLVIGMNWGNAGNREALTVGYGWKDEDVEAVLNRYLTDSHWNFIEGAWGIVEGLKPEAFAVEKRVTGVEPKAVIGITFTLASGRKIEGKYFPLKYDGAQAGAVSARHGRKEEADLLKEIGMSFTKPMTRTGHTIERVGSGGKPVKIAMETLFNHLENVVHDITHREALIDAVRIIKDPEFITAYQNAAGLEQYNRLMPWLTDIATKNGARDRGMFAGVMSHLRAGTSATLMGFKFGTAIQQFTGWAEAVPEIGLDWVLRGMVKTYAGGPITFFQQWQFVNSKSDYLMTRLQFGKHRDVRAQTTKVGDRTPLREIQDSQFMFLSGLDAFIGTSVWVSSYDKAVAGKVKDIAAGDEEAAVAFADRIVRFSLSSSETYALPEMMRGTEMDKWLTAIYTYGAKQYNRTRTKIYQVRYGQIGIPEFTAAMFVMHAVLPIMAAFLAARLLPGDDEEEEVLLENAGTEVMMNLTGMFPFFRDVVGTFIKPEFGYQMSPVEGSMEKVIGASRRAAEGESLQSEAGAKELVFALGVVFKLPGTQLWVTGEYAYDVATGEEDPLADPVDAVSEGLIRNTR